MITLDDFYISSVFKGLSGNLSRAGYVPQANINDIDKFLKSDGTWTDVNTIANFSHKKIIVPSQPPGDEYFDNVSLLLNMEGANNSTLFIDSSKNNFTVSRYGQASISTTIFKYSNSSGFLPLSGVSYLAAPQTAAFAFPSDFTLEFWMYPLSFTNDMVLFDGCELNGNGVRADTFALLTNTLSGLYLFSNGLTIGTTTTTISGQTWSHIAYDEQTKSVVLINRDNLQASRLTANNNNYTVAQTVQLATPGSTAYFATIASNNSGTFISYRAIMDSDRFIGARSTDGGLTFTNLTVPAGSYGNWQSTYYKDKFIIGDLIADKFNYSTNSGTTWTESVYMFVLV